VQAPCCFKGFLTSRLEKYKKNHGIYSTPISVFYLGEDKRKSSATHTKDFCGKNVPKLPAFEENISEIVT
jgi:hypothetical protein